MHAYKLGKIWCVMPMHWLVKISRNRLLTIFPGISKISMAPWLMTLSKKNNCGKVYVNSFLSSPEIKVDYFSENISHVHFHYLANLTLHWTACSVSSAFVITSVRLIEPTSLLYRFHKQPQRSLKLNISPNGNICSFTLLLVVKLNNKTQFTTPLSTQSCK